MSKTRTEQLNDKPMLPWAGISLLIGALTTGGGTSLGNILTGGGGSDQTSSIERLSGDVRDLTYAVRQSWTVPMEITAWDKAGRELRKTITEWQGPDVAEIRRAHYYDERVEAHK